MGWQIKTWREVYGSEITGVPWFSVMGNHDFGSFDATSACPNVNPRFRCDTDNRNSPACGGARPYSTEAQGYAGNQLNADKGGIDGEGRKNYHMPDYTYYYTIPELNFELIAMDWNWVAVGLQNDLGGDGIHKGANKVLAHCGSEQTLRSSLKS